MKPHCPSAPWLATETLESWPTQPSLFPEGEKETPCTQPPPPLENSAMQAPNVIFFPQQVASGFSSISFTYPENTLWYSGEAPLR